MKDKWRLAFCGLNGLSLIFSWIIYGWAGVIIGYLWVGILIHVVSGFIKPLIIVLWLPALWSERIRNLL